MKCKAFSGCVGTESQPTYPLDSFGRSRYASRAGFLEVLFLKCHSLWSVMPFSAIVAATPNGTIGFDGDMPWRLSSDLRRFKRLTMGSIIVMGRKTFDSIGKALPGRDTFVLTRDHDWKHEGVRVFNSIEALLSGCETRPTFVVGGAQVYNLLLPYCDELYLTRVWSQVAGDTVVEIDLSQWRCRFVERIPCTARDSVPTEFTIWDRIREQTDRTGGSSVLNKSL